MFVAAEDFNLMPYNLPNLDRVGDTFPAYVEREEELALIRILGRLLYEKLKAQLPIVEGTTPQRWKDLVNGVKYSHDGVRYYWSGMKSIFVPYIFSRWTKDNADDLTSIGVVEADAENSLVKSPAAKISLGYNDFSIKVEGLRKCDWYKDSLLGFLHNSGNTYVADISEDGYTSIQDYLMDHFKSPGKINEFGL